MAEQDLDDPILACIEAALKAVCGGDRANASSVLASLDVQHSKRQREMRLLEVARGVRATSEETVPKPRRRSIPFAEKHGCNDARGDFLLEEVGWQLLPPADEPWDGFRSWLPRLRQVAAGGQPKQG